MTDKQTPTPTPWREGPLASIWVAEYRVAASDISNPHACDDAALIVRAVNSHEALVEALRAYVDEIGPGDLVLEKTLVHLYEKARAALALAEGTP